MGRDCHKGLIILVTNQHKPIDDPKNQVIVFIAHLMDKIQFTHPGSLKTAINVGAKPL